MLSLAGVSGAGVVQGYATGIVPHLLCNYQGI